MTHECPSCHRPILSTQIRHCLYCQAEIPEDIRKSIPEPEAREIQALFIVTKSKEEKNQRQAQTAARFMYGCMTLLSLFVSLSLVLYGLEKNPEYSILGVIAASLFLAISVFTGYKTFRPEPLTKLPGQGREK